MGDEQCDARFLLRKAGRADEEVVLLTRLRERRVAGLLQRKKVQREVASTGEDVGQLAQQATADVEGAHAEGRGGGGSRQGRGGW